MKKKFLIGIIIVLLLLLAIGIIYAIDMNRMRNNKPVIFSTWGYSYVPPINLPEEELNAAITNYLITKLDNDSKHHENEKGFVSYRTYLMEEKEKNKLYNFYCWVLEEKYYLEDDEIKQDSGSSIPYKFIIEFIDNEFIVIDIEIPRDGTYYSEDMKVMFPEDVLNNMNKIHDDGTMNSLKADIEKQKNEYFSKNIVNNDNPSFFGKVVESDASYIIVEPNEDEEERKSSDQFSISLGKYNDALYEIGTNVKITYTGLIMETYPAQIDVTNIEIKSADNFEILFYQKQPIDSYKTYTILDKSETEKYDYTIYGHDGSVNIRIDGKDYSLKEALVENKITMDEIIAKANIDLKNGKITGETYKDGGSIVYKYDTYTIIKCHTLDGNRDVYIGAPNMTINDVI
ncbi:MAG: hypothetical protein Q4G09_00845 [Clostridia bacterium]|nr:hypothetical protein [Clostridia bacterium]